MDQYLFVFEDLECFPTFDYELVQSPCNLGGPERLYYKK